MLDIASHVLARTIHAGVPVPELQFCTLMREDSRTAVGRTTRWEHTAQTPLHPTGSSPSP